MALAVAPTPQLIIIGGQIQFQATGGVAPYTWAVQAGGAGGIIDPALGLYVAPLVVGQDVVVATDSLGATAQATVTVNQAIKMLGDIIQQSLGLAVDQIKIWNQKLFIPNDSRLYVTLSVLRDKIFSNSEYEQPGPGGTVQQVQRLSVASMVQIDLLSQGPDARDRRHEVLLALRSVYGQQQAAWNGLGISRLSTEFINLSQVDGAAIPWRFQIGVTLTYQMSKITSVPYFSQFSPPVLQEVNP